MKVYLGGSISGGRQFAENLAVICQMLEERGDEVLSKGYVVEHERTIGAEELSPEAIVLRDLGDIEKADYVVLEVSQSSHGVGGEHVYAGVLGKPVLLLRHDSLAEESRRSAFLSGMRVKFSTCCFAYYGKEDLRSIVEGFVSEFFPEVREGAVRRERQI